jgi:hypothetical protein
MGKVTKLNNSEKRTEERHIIPDLSFALRQEKQNCYDRGRVMVKQEHRQIY